MVKQANHPFKLLSTADFIHLEYPTKALEANVVFGQTSRRCQGSGICRVDMVTAQVDPSLALNCCGFNRASISCNEVGRLRFSFSASTLCKKMANKQFRQGWFRVEEDFQVPNWINEQLDCNNACIKAGIYSVKQIDQYWVIDF